MPENAGYYHAAYIAVVIIYGGYVLSLVIRSRRARERERRRGGNPGVARETSP